MKTIFLYLRVSDSTQISGDGFTRQETACRNYAKAHGMEVSTVFKEDISGTELNRPVLASLMVSLEQNGHGIKTVAIERLDRLERDLMIQETIVRDFQSKGFELISVEEGPDLCDNSPTRKFIRQVLGAAAEFDKSMLVAKLRASRYRMRAKTGRCEGRHGYSDSEEGKALIRHVKTLQRRPKYARGRTYKGIADYLNQAGMKTLDGKQFTLFRVRDIIS